jgi:glycosyltransferase involved in cell wall biosynthesis
MLSVIALTRNEEKHIRACLASVRDFADELIVLDSGSTDRTMEIAREGGARVEQRAFDNYPNQRNHALALARGEWIFFIDADERATPAVGREIQSRISQVQSPMVGYWIPRRNILFGKEIRHTGWSPDYQPRVMKKGCARFDPARAVHELVVWDGQAGYLREPLMHYNYETVAQFRAKQIVYTRYEAQVWCAEGKRAHWRGAIGQPIREFFRRYIGLHGWRDGGHGLLLSALMAYYALVRWQMLREMQK